MAGPLLIGLLTQVAGVRVAFVTCGALAAVLLIALARSEPLRLRPRIDDKMPSSVE